MKVTKQVVHLVMAAIWGAYALVTGTLAIYTGYHSTIFWDTVIVSVSANSVHLVTFSLSKNGAEISTEATPTTPS